MGKSLTFVMERAIAEPVSSLRLIATRAQVCHFHSRHSQTMNELSTYSWSAHVSSSRNGEQLNTASPRKSAHAVLCDPQNPCVHGRQSSCISICMWKRLSYTLEDICFVRCHETVYGWKARPSPEKALDLTSAPACTVQQNNISAHIHFIWRSLGHARLLNGLSIYCTEFEMACAHTKLKTFLFPWEKKNFP